MKYYKKYPKGQSSEWILTIGILIALTLLLYQVKQVIVYQVKTSEDSALESEARQIASMIDGIGSVNGYAETTYKMRRDLNYRLTINGKKVEIENLENNQTAFAYFSHPCVYEAEFENVREIIIKKEDECVEVGKYTPPVPCVNKDDCEDGYCWGTKPSMYYCHNNCGEAGKYAPDKENCCDDLIIENGKCSIPPTPCSTKDDCDMGYCWGEQVDEYYCHSNCGPDSKYAPEKDDCCMEWNQTTKKCESPGNMIRVLIVTTSDVYDQLGSLMDEYISALKSDGYNATVIRLDTDDVKTCSDSFLPTSIPVSSQSAQIIIPTCIEKLESKYLIIIGGYNSIRQKRLPAGSCHDPTGEYFSDDWYGDLNNDGIVDVPVGRIPTGISNDITPIRAYIQSSIELHKNHELLKKNSFYGLLMHEYKSNGWRLWVDADKFSFDMTGGNCKDPYCHFSYYADPRGSGWNSRTDIFYINLHGAGSGNQIGATSYNKDNPNGFGPPFGEKGYVISLDPATLSSKNIEKTIILSASCYGGRIHNVDAYNSLIATSFINGAIAYIGGTATEFGIVTKTIDVTNYNEVKYAVNQLNSACNIQITGGLFAGDACLYHEMMSDPTYHTLGDKFMHIKAFYLQNTNNYGDPACHYRVWHETLLYGDPTLKTSW